MFVQRSPATETPDDMVIETELMSDRPSVVGEPLVAGSYDTESLATTSAECVVCVEVLGDGPETTHLKRLGLCQGRSIQVLRKGNPMIVAVVGTTVALSRELAMQIVVGSIERQTITNTRDLRDSRDDR